MRTLLLVAAMACTLGAWATSPLTLRNDSIPADTVAADTVKTKAAKPQKKTESEYEKLMKKGGTATEGLFGVRHIEDNYYFEVPDTMLGRLLLCVTRFTAVPQGFGQYAGEEITHCAVYFEQRDSATLILRQYVQSHLSDPDNDISRTLERSTTDPIVKSFKIIDSGKNNGRLLVEVTPLFKTDSHLTSLSAAQKTKLKVGGLQADRTFIDTMKVYPQNIEVATTRTYSATPAAWPASRTGAVTIGINTSVVALPEEPMRKRLWDERVGYFVNSFVHFSDQQHKTEHEAFVSRYKLVPKNKKKYLRGELTEPEQPIVYYIDPATPSQWVPYLIQGVNDWNVAFEAAGFKNAIKALPWPKDNPTMSLDDARYSVIRYLPSETENAYGPRIVDPRSGQIIEAHIGWYHNVMNLLTKWYMVQCGPLDKRAQTMHFDQKLMGQLIRFVSSHEVGHTLGLRHNMGASFATPVELLRNKQWVEAHGHTSSIMDYARFNYVAQPEDNISEKGLFPRIGDYDCWAIKWGYQWRPEFADEYEEKKQLMTETTHVLSGNQRLWFGGEGRNDDPRAQTEDLGDDNMKASDYGIRNLKRVMQHLPQWTQQDNYQYEDLQNMYRAVQEQYMRYVNHVMKNLGGRYRNNMPDKQPYANVEPKREQDAVAFVGRHVFDAPEWLYPENIISKTGTNAALDQGQRQEAILTRMMTPTLLNTIGNRDDYPLQNYFSCLFEQVFTTNTGGTPFKERARRQLQRSYVQNLGHLLCPSESELKSAANLRSYNSDAILYAAQHLSHVEQYCREQLNAAEPNTIEALHFDDLLRQISLIQQQRTKAK